MLKALMQRLGLVLAGILVAFVVAEIAVRMFDLAPAEFYTYDRHAGWKIKPGAYGWQTHEGRALIEANSDGFRGPEYAVENRPARCASRSSAIPSPRLSTSPSRIPFAPSPNAICRRNVPLPSAARAARSASLPTSK